MSKPILSLAKRFWIYQSERFPFLTHSPLLAAFTFSAISFSLVCRGQIGFIDSDTFLVGLITTISLFFLLRISDEFKDEKIDAKYRPELPVPRGLITLRELGMIGLGVIVFILILNTWLAPQMLLLLIPSLLFLWAMRYEFGIGKLLKSNPILYMISHMFVMPVIDFYATGLDWLNEGASPHDGLVLFLIVSFLNGIVIEWGRKIRTPEDESEGVDTYSKSYGYKRSSIIWILILLLTGVIACLASIVSGSIKLTWPILTILFIICASPAISFALSPSKKRANVIEKSAGVWTIGMYLTLGAVPMINLFLE